MPLPLKNKVAFITGASRGIGQACAISLAQAGAHCIISARTQGGLIQTDNEIRKYGQQATLLPLDLGATDPKHSIDTIGPSIAAQFGCLDIFIHAAFQFVPLTPVVQISDQVWEKNIVVNLTSCRKLIRTLSPVLCATKNSHAIFLQNTKQPEAFWGPVAIIQAAIETMVGCWQKEVAHLSTLTATCFAPPPTDTLLRRSFFPAESKSALISAQESAEKIMSFILPISAQ